MRSLKKITSIILAAAMIVGGSLTAFAAGSDGTGSYEGGAMKYPTLSVTLPTIDAGTYNYIADPNGLIAATSAAKYANSVWDSNAKGLFFLNGKDATETSKDFYTYKSKAFTVTNSNAQDIKVKVSVAQKTAGSEGIAYSNTATFENTDKDKKIYLAVTDGADSNPKVSAVSADTAAEITFDVAGIPGNYKANYDSTNGYGYVLKDTGLTDWNTCSAYLTGALNTGATWGDNLTFPTITVTWSFSEVGAEATPSGTGMTASSETGVDYEATFTKGTAYDINFTGVNAATWAATVDGTYATSANITVGTDKVTIAATNWGGAQAGNVRYVKVSDGTNTYVIKFTIAAGN